ncbi:MAG: trehalase family glycosidase [Planctomycetota bacterium]|nr:trehalase family glycosidase [Planctomycetota bacterium]
MQLLLALALALPLVGCASAPTSKEPLSEIDAVRQGLATGWNTWNTHSLTSHVLLPERLEINVGFVDEYNSNYVSDFSSQHAPRYGEHGLRGETTDITLAVHDKPFRVETAAFGKEFVMRITPSAAMQGTEFFSVTAGGIWGGAVDALRRGDSLVVTCGTERHVLEALSPTRRPKWDPTRGAHLTFPSDAPIYLRLASRRTREEIDAALLEARETFLAGVLGSEGELEEGLAALRRVLLWNTVYDPQSGQVFTPVNRSWTRPGSHFGHYVLFGWDTFFGALMLGMLDRDLAYANAVAMLERATPNGMVPNWGGAGGHVSMDRSEPQVGSWCIYKLYLQHGDVWFLEECYDALLAWNEWRFRERDKNGNGLMELGSLPPDPLPPGVTERFAADQARTNVKRRATWESGLDNSPMWDKATTDDALGAMQLDYAGLNGLMVADCLALARIAEVLGEDEDARALEARATALQTRIDADLWSAERGTYLNRTWDGAHEPTLSLTHFYPLLGGLVPAARVESLLEGYLLSPEHFWTNYVVPNVPRSEPSFADQAYWRGRVWGPTNFLVSEACRRSGRDDIAARIASRSLDLLLVAWRERGAVCENFNAVEGKGKGDNRNDPFYTWGALLAYLSVQEFLDVQGWDDQVKLGSSAGLPAAVLRNVPFRGTRLTITSERGAISVRADGQPASTHQRGERFPAAELTPGMR